MATWGVPWFFWVPVGKKACQAGQLRQMKQGGNRACSPKVIHCMYLRFSFPPRKVWGINSWEALSSTPEFLIRSSWNVCTADEGGKGAGIWGWGSELQSWLPHLLARGLQQLPSPLGDRASPFIKQGPLPFKVPVCPQLRSAAGIAELYWMSVVCCDAMWRAKDTRNS